MQVGPLVEEFEVVGGGEVPLHHVDEAIVVLDAASRVLHQQCTRLPQHAAHLAAQGGDSWVLLPGVGQVRRQIHNCEFHSFLPSFFLQYHSKRKTE